MLDRPEHKAPQLFSGPDQRFLDMVFPQCEIIISLASFIRILDASMGLRRVLGGF